MDTLYRASPKDGVAWVTGASSGIGLGTAMELARRGFTVIASARRLEALQEVAARAEGLPGRIIPYAADVTDKTALVALVADVEERYGPIVLCFLNAGIYFPLRAKPFDDAAFKQTFEVNVFGVINGLAAVLPKMTDRRRGQIAINASVAGYGGLPRAAAYSGSKAALIVMAESLKMDMDALGITLQIVNPGFVKTPLTDKNDHPMPFLMELDDASRLICDGFERGGFEITFPWQLATILKFLRFLPYRAYFALLRAATRWPPR
jgi:NAD(P)-dependent dehydrogenase (short-subunit alcohol dehydrogenase family)